MQHDVDGGEIQLDEESITQFHESGVLGPFRLCSPEEMESVRDHVWNTIAQESSEEPMGNFIDRHEDCSVISDIVTHPAIVQRMTDLYGPDLVCTSSRIWPKPPGETVVPWHQDGAYYPFNPTTTISAWVALTEATEENGCVRLIPGTHREGYVSHRDVSEPEKTLFPKEIEPEEVPDEEVVTMELEPGEFFLFTEKTIHSSTSNETDDPRVGLSIRASPSFIHLFPDDNKPRRDLMLLHGENHNPTTTTFSSPTDCQH